MKLTSSDQGKGALASNGADTRDLGVESAPIDLLRQKFREARAAGDRPTSAEMAVAIAKRSGEAHWLHEASHALKAIDDEAGALDYAEQAFSLSPDSEAIRMNLGILRVRTGDYTGAVWAILPLLESGSAPAEAYHQLAAAVESMGDRDLAISMARKAIERQPDHMGRRLFVASIHARGEAWGAAIAAVRAAEAELGQTAVSRRTMSGYLAKLGEHKEALAAIDTAIELEPERAEFFLHKLGLLKQLGLGDQMLETLEAVITLDPANLKVRRQAVSHYVEAGEIKKALKTGAGLVSEAPDNPEYLSCMRFLLDARKGEELSEEVGDIAALKASGPPRQYRDPPGSMARVRSTLGVISALVLRELLVRHGRNRLGFLWAIVEPAAHVAVLALIFQFSIKAPPPLGENFFFFYFTGVAPFLLMSRVTMQCGHAVLGNRSILEIPVISPVDLALSKLIVEVFTMVIVVLIFSAIFFPFGLADLPTEFGKILVALFTAAVFGLGMGCVFASTIEFGRLAESFFTVLTRLFYVTGGIFFVPAMIPLQFREILMWNPFLHIVSLSRDGFFTSYDAPEFNGLYLFSVVAGVLAIGLVMLRFVSPIMRTQK